MKLLVFAGSSRQNSFNRSLAAAAASIARDAGADVSHIELGDFEVPMYNADLEAQGTPADVVRLKELFYEHPAWIICSPEYNGSYTALLKNTIDWVMEQRQQAVHRQGGGHAQRVERCARGLALSKPSGTTAAEPSMLACAQGLRVVSRSRRLRCRRRAARPGAPQERGGCRRAGIVGSATPAARLTRLTG